MMESEINGSMDTVQEASEESFPASDAPAWAMGTEDEAASDPVETGAVEFNEAENRFKLSSGGQTAYLTFRRRPNTIVFVHVEVPGDLAGRGIGSQLSQAGLEFARDQGLQVVPLCPFVAKYIARHPEFLKLVPAEHRARVDASNL
jgi:predicted GNAT family acetyltransferase